MRSIHVHTFTFILAVVGMVGCLGRFDYNLVLALGWIFLSDKNPSFSNSFGLYFMVIGSIIIDLITIFASANQKDRFSFSFVPILEIILKIAILTFSLYQKWKKDNQNQQNKAEQL